MYNQIPSFCKHGDELSGFIREAERMSIAIPAMKLNTVASGVTTYTDVGTTGPGLGLMAQIMYGPGSGLGLIPENMFGSYSVLVQVKPIRHSMKYFGLSSLFPFFSKKNMILLVVAFIACS